jgi:hypothetical protein
MKKIIPALIILIIFSCSIEDMDKCLCFEVEEINVEKKVWTGGAWMYIKEWEDSGERKKVEGCYTDRQTQYMTRQVSYNQRWYVNCLNN